MIAGVCLLAFTFTITVCGHTLNKRQDIDSCTNFPPDLIDCINDLASGDITVFCSSNCRSDVEDYYERCLGGAALNTLRTSLSSICGTTDMPGIDDSCQNITTDLQECIDGFNNRDTIVTCSSNCTAELEYHYEMCFEGDVEAFRQSYSLLCDSPTIDNCLNITTGLEQCLNNFTIITLLTAISVPVVLLAALN
jgi:hypothetical protein